MASSLRFMIFFAYFVLSRANASAEIFNHPFTTTTSPAFTASFSPPPPETQFSSSATTASSLPPPAQSAFFTSSTSATTSPSTSISHDVNDHSFFSHTALLGPILSHLGFNELAMAAPSLSSDSAATAWSGPSTLFAPSDSSLRTCYSCSVPNLLREHIVPGLFTIDYLRQLAFGTKIETLSPGRCITVTSTTTKNATSSSTVSKVFIGGVEITHPDMFNNGLVVVHGIQGYVSPLSPFSCDFERLNTLTFPYHAPDRVASSSQMIQHQPLAQPAMMRLMIRDAMLRLRNNGYSILSLAMRVKYNELVNLSNFTVFALDDVSIFSGSHSYISSIRFHIVPNYLLTMSDLEKLPVGATFPTLEREQSLVVTTSCGGGLAGGTMRINYVRIKVPEVIRNLKIVVHSIYLPFPRIHPNSAYEGMLGGEHIATESACSALEDGGSCGTVPVPPVKQPTVEIDDHHGL